MKIKKIKVYEFTELSEEAKQTAIDKWYEDENYPFLSEQLNESLLYLLKENKILPDDDTLKLYYSLSNSQGDGVCFVGSFKWKQYNINIGHGYGARYYHKHSTNINIEPIFSREATEKVYDDFMEIYYEICNILEKEGYGVLEYRMDFNEFQEHCESNEYTFLENGTMENL